jgi:hypothetical protein
MNTNENDFIKKAKCRFNVYLKFCFLDDYYKNVKVIFDINVWIPFLFKSVLSKSRQKQLYNRKKREEQMTYF